MADFLIKTGADIELGCSTPLMEAAQEGHLELVKYLLAAGEPKPGLRGPAVSSSLPPQAQRAPVSVPGRFAVLGYLMGSDLPLHGGLLYMRRPDRAELRFGRA